MSNDTQVVVSTVNPADLTPKLKDATQVAQLQRVPLASIDWAAKLKVRSIVIIDIRIFILEDFILNEMHIFSKWLEDPP